jgi:hypothetical protein
MAYKPCCVVAVVHHRNLPRVLLARITRKTMKKKAYICVILNMWDSIPPEPEPRPRKISSAKETLM